MAFDPPPGKMNALGLYTGLDMRNQSLEFMQANFGKAGGYYHWISRGVDNLAQDPGCHCLPPKPLTANVLVQTVPERPTPQHERPRRVYELVCGRHQR